MFLKGAIPLICRIESNHCDELGRVLFLGSPSSIALGFINVPSSVKGDTVWLGFHSESHRTHTKTTGVSTGTPGTDKRSAKIFSFHVSIKDEPARLWRLKLGFLSEV